MTALSLVLIVGLSQSASALPAQTSRDTCEIRGRITDKETGAPIPRAIVRLGMIDGGVQLATRADEEGRYQFTDVSPGAYGGFVEPGEFRATHLTGGFGGPLVLKRGEVRTGVDAALGRARAMTVRVVDEAGQPLAGLRIGLNSVGDGRNMNWQRFVDTTDDRGGLRLYKLQPGRYTVCAEPPAMTGAPARRERFVRTCYPSAPTAAQAEPVQLEGADIEDLVIRMRRGRTFTISGTLLDSSGAPAPGVMVSLGQFERGGSSSTTGGRVSRDGAFTIANVAPGEYAIEASFGGPGRPEQRREAEEAFVPIRIESDDLTGLVVSMARTVEVAGRFILEDSTVPLPRPSGSGLFISARLAGDELRGSGSMRFSNAGDDRVFYLDRMFGRRTLEVANIPRGWYVKSIRYEGKEIIDVPTEFKASRDPSALEIVLSTRGATMAGHVADERGEVAKGGRVVLFPANPAAWRKYELTSAAVSSTGAFRLGPLRGGDYLVVALDPSVPAPEPGDRDRLARLAESAERIRLNEHEERTVDLRVVKVR